MRLCGRLGATAEERVLPSGDALVAFRVVVDRPATGRERAPTVDAIDCASFRADVRRAVLRWSPGDVVEVTGALRRHFWRSAAGPSSRTEVEVASVRRARRTAAS
ncbi:MAG TPA: single-stranded DNA-binding protein [Mycobacteriales bacterium]|nr:single-stranded DNA-binding protein [Mycobacteriales bacterium]